MSPYPEPVERVPSPEASAKVAEWLLWLPPGTYESGALYRSFDEDHPGLLTHKAFSTFAQLAGLIKTRTSTRRMFVKGAK